MKLEGSQSFDINWLKGQLLINENGADFLIKDVLVDVASHKVLIQLDTEACVEWDSIKNWSIHFQGGRD